MTYCITTKQTDIGEEIILHENTLLMYEDFCVYNKDEVEIPFEYDKVKKAFENGSIIRISEEDFNRLKGIYECTYHIINAKNSYTLESDGIKSQLSDITNTLTNTYTKFCNDSISRGSRIIK